MTKIISHPSTPEFRSGYDGINWHKNSSASFLRSFLSDHPTGEISVSALVMPSSLLNERQQREWLEENHPEKDGYCWSLKEGIWEYKRP